MILTNPSLARCGSFTIFALILSAVLAASPLAVLAASGDLYVTNLATNTIDVYSPDGAKSTFASGLDSPQGLVFDRAHNLFVADAGSRSIFKYDTSGNQTLFLSGLSAPVGIAIDRKRLLIAESGLGRFITVPLDQSGGPQVFLTRDEPILGVAAANDTRYLTYSTVLNSESFNSGTFWDFDAETRGVLPIAHFGRTRVDIYVTTANGDVWLIKHRVSRIFASGLSNPNGMAFLPGRIGGAETGELYVADRGTGEIFKYAPDGTGSIFVSDAGTPNFLAFDLP